MNTSDHKKDKDKVYEAGHTTITIECEKDGHLRLNRKAFNDFLTDSKIGEKPFCIISICGAAREGKSFMMNLILRHFEKQTWQKDNSTIDKGGPFRMTAFKVNKGHDSVTAGILVYNYIFEVKTKGGDRMAVILMDTQGVFRPDVKKVTEDFLLTVTTLISSVQILNVSKTCDATRLDAMKSAITYGELSSGQDRYLKLQDLIVLIRDLGEAMTEDECENHLKKLIMDEKIGGKQSTDARAKIRKAFSHVQLYGLPHPGKVVAKLTMEDHDIKNDAIDIDFLKSVDEFLAKAINPLERLAPKFTNDGKPIKIRDLYKLMILCDDNFKEAVADTEFDAKKIIEAEDRVAYENKFEELYTEFVDKIKDVVGETEEAIRISCSNLSRKTLEKFVQEVSQWKVSNEGKQHETKYMERLKEQMQNAISNHVLTWIGQKLGEKLKLEGESERLFEEYVKSLKSCDTMTKLSKKHDSFLSKLKECTPKEYDEKILMDRITDKHQKMEQSLRLSELEKTMKEKLRKDVDQHKSNKSSPEYESSVKIWRAETIRSKVEILRNKMHDIWIELMNDKANKCKLKSGISMLSDPWKETKSLTLEEKDIEDIYVRVKRKVLREYWTSILQDIEIQNIKKLNEKLLEEWASNTRTQSHSLSQYGLPLHLPSKASSAVGRTVNAIVDTVWKDGGSEGKRIYFQVNEEEYRQMIQNVVEEFRKTLTTDESIAKCQPVEMNEDISEKYAQVLGSMHILFLRLICPALANEYRRLKTLLGKSKEEIAKMRIKIKEDIKRNLIVCMRIAVPTTEREYLKIMAEKHYVEENIEAAYMDLLDEGFDKIHQEITDGHQIMLEVKDEVYEKAGVNESLKNVLRINKENQDGLIDTNNTDVPKTEASGFFANIIAFFRGIFSWKWKQD